jgi:hypothetical protein
MLSNLVAQITAGPFVKPATLRTAKCPMCKDRPKDRSRVTGKLQTYCSECNRERVRKRTAEEKNARALAKLNEGKEVA